MITLYYNPRTRASRVRWMLEELGVPYVLKHVDLQKEENKTPGFLKMNPQGTLPFIVDGDLKMSESAAICAYLADKYPEKCLAPPVGSEARAGYYQWLFFGMSTLEAPVVQLYLHTQMLAPEKRSQFAADEARSRLHRFGAVLNHALESREFLVDDTFTAADIIVGSIVNWGSFLGAFSDFPGLRAYGKRLIDRPAYARATAKT